MPATGGNTQNRGVAVGGGKVFLATYDDYDGVYFTLQSMRIANPGLVDDIGDDPGQRPRA